MSHTYAVPPPPPPPYRPYVPAPPRPVFRLSGGQLLALAAVLVAAYVFLFMVPRYGAWTACGAHGGQAMWLAAGFESPSLTECALMKWGTAR